MSINFGTQSSQYPNGIDSTYTQNFIKTAQILASTNYGTFITTSDHLPRQDLSTYDQVNHFFHEGLKAFSIEENYNDFMPLVFPLTEAGPKTETTTLININKFSGQPTSRVGQKYFTTQYNETFLNTKELIGSGFQVSTEFVNTPMGTAMFRVFIQVCIDSLRLSLKQKIYEDGILALSDPYMETMAKTHRGNIEQFIDVMNSRKKLFWNIVGKRPERCLETIEEKMFEDQNKISCPKLDTLIFHPSVDVVRKIDVNWRNDSKGQYNNTDGPQNKIYAHDRVFKLGTSNVYYQETIEIAKGHFYDPFANVGVCGEHFLMPNAYHSFPELHSEQKRSIKIWDDFTKMHELISYTDAVVHTAHLYNSIQEAQKTTFKDTFSTSGKTLKVEDVINMNEGGKLKTSKDEIRDFCRKRFQNFILSQLPDDEEKKIVDLATSTKTDPSDATNSDPIIKALKDPSTRENIAGNNGLAFAQFFATEYLKIRTVLKTKFGISDGGLIQCLELYNKCLNNETCININGKGVLSPSTSINNGIIQLYKDDNTLGMNYFEKMCYYIFMSIVIGVNDTLNTQTISLLSKNAIEIGWNVLVVRRRMVYKNGNGVGVLSRGGTLKRGTNKLTPKVVVDEENDEYRMGVTQYQQARKINPKAIYRINNVAPIAHLIGGSTAWTKDFKEIKKISLTSSIEAQTFDIYGMFVPMNSKFNHTIIHTSDEELGAKHQLNKLIGKNLFQIYKHIVPNQSSLEDFMDHFDIIRVLPSEISDDHIQKKKVFANSITDPGPYMRLDLMIQDRVEIFPGDSCWHYISNDDGKKRFMSQNY